MLGSTGRVMIDFGVRSLQNRGDTTRADTLGYSSPEEIRGGLLDRRSSVYSVGIVLWEMLTGRTLFPHYGRMIPRRHKPNRDPGRRPFLGVISPGVVRPDLPEELKAICCVALKTNPRRRFRECGELGAELEDFLEAGGHDGVAGLKAFMTDLYAADFELERKSRTVPWPSKAPPKPS
jgi:serine/threonine-protein kinase